MQISSNMGSATQAMTSSISSSHKTVFSEKLSKDEISNLKEQIKQSTNAFSFNSASAQGIAHNNANKLTQDYNDFQSFLSDVGYSGKPIANLSQDEAAALVSEDGIFGIKQTSERIANFVINGAGGDEDMLRAGREGMLRGFKEAEQAFGKLPDISQKTMQIATEMVDKAMHDLGFSIINQEA